MFFSFESMHVGLPWPVYCDFCIFYLFVVDKVLASHASWVASSLRNPASKMLWKTQVRKFENCYWHPHIDKFTTHFCNLQKSYRSFTKAYRTWFSSFSSSLSEISSEICYPRFSEILQKHYGSPRSHFLTQRGRRLPPSSPRRARLLPP